ncbi:MAG: glycosyltransferase family 2 protein [Lachnospiraceae bacterium]|nr:glycosyltransferase family 2 protein [Lachnospiraceae bacterium]
MKLLSVVIPCYNSSEYMGKCIRSVLEAGERVEIIIVDDGSSDDTLSIANQYATEYPNIVKAIHQENGGHGSAVNTGLENATGLYFKVVDSDDCLGKNAIKEVMELLKSFDNSNQEIDMLITNFLYDKQGVKHKKVMSYNHAMPKNRIFGWDEMKLGVSQYLLMHSVIYRTEVLRESGMVLPKHTFYVDNIYVFQPLPFVKKMYYMDVVLYKYFIGREDQSVNEKVMIGRLDMQYKVTRLMLDAYMSTDDKEVNCDKTMVHYFDMMMCVSSILSILSNSKQRLEDKKKLWEELKIKNPKLYKRVRFTSLGITMNLPGPVGRGFSVLGYRVTQKIFGFN